MDHLTLTTKQLAVEVDGTIEGIAWPYATPDRAGDIIVKGALRLPVAELPMLRNHDTDSLIGLWNTIEERDDGLHVKGRLNLKESMLARGVRSQILTGRLNGLSIGFRDRGSTRRGRNRVLSAIELVEVSIVREPSHPEARITHSKSFDAARALAEAINRATAALTMRTNP
ncbi:HK97 family phage prohead protease [Jiella endophytica]|uniref:HK97 family phage prohead protease n=1 Tax=Jiella endophytica TaxID=2558362 RepID=A0A4Y8RVH3_9HYPH|nr:HK97 family phage prohead protease [Jiella endophytica]TFF27521.1 HK97 family phage prohead protease [Jiella endophytica]